MKKSVMYLAGAAVAAVAALAAGPSKAAVITFGDLGAQTTGCTHSGSDAGLVCPSPQTFTSSGVTITATGWSAAPGTSTQTAITFKPTSAFGGAPANALDESGLGQNTAGPPAACDDPSSSVDCEIGGNHSVALVSDTLLDDVAVASVQSGEQFQVYTGTSLATLIPFGGVRDCGGSTMCEVTFGSALAVAVQNIGSGNVLIAQASFSPQQVPEPASLTLLGSALLAFAWGVRRRKHN